MATVCSSLTSFLGVIIVTSSGMEGDFSPANDSGMVSAEGNTLRVSEGFRWNLAVIGNGCLPWN